MSLNVRRVLLVRKEGALRGGGRFSITYLWSKGPLCTPSAPWKIPTDRWVVAVAL